MRLAENQIKQGILHHEQLIRVMALRYFSESFSQDPTVMPLAIGAIETPGWDGAFESLWGVGKLVQTEETFFWFIDQLNRLGHPKAQQDVDQSLCLSSVISDADIGLLMKHEAKIMGIEGLGAEAREVIAERLRLLTVDTDACWAELEVFCEEIKGEQYIDKVDIPHAERLGEAIVRGGDAYADRILSILSQTQDSHKNSPMPWMECFAAWIAGELRLEAAVPLLIAKLKADADDLMNEECERAFIKIGTDSTVEAICKNWSSAPWHFKLYASASLEHIHCDLAAARCLELHGQEAKADIRLNLLRAVLNNFSSEGIEPARQMVRRKNLELRGELVAVTTLMGVSFPELKDWLKEERELAERRKRHSQELAETYALPVAQKSKAPSFDNLIQPKPHGPIVHKAKAGRNDPCPCGSGKKYKKCCMGKET